LLKPSNVHFASESGRRNDRKLVCAKGRNVPFAVVQGVCKYAGDKVGNRPIAAGRNWPLCGRQSGKMNFVFVPEPDIREVLNSGCST
jgi:hypothetical protein